MEHRHPGITSAFIDTWIPALDGVGVALEFKYDRDIPCGKNSPRTQKAGKIFQDLYRLGQFNTTAHRVFVYLASDEMTSHSMSKRNRLSEFFSLAPGRSLRIDDAFLAGRAKSFVSMLGATPNVEAVALYARGLPHGHQVRAYEVHGFESLTSAPSTAKPLLLDVTEMLGPAPERVALAQAPRGSIDADLRDSDEREAVVEAIRRDEELSSGM